MATKRVKQAKVTIEDGLETTDAAAPVRVEDLPEPGEDWEEPEPAPKVESEPAPRIKAPRTRTPKVKAPKEPTKAEILAERRRTSPKAAAKHVTACLRMLGSHDWPTIGIDGIAGAIAVLRSALPKLEASATKRATFKFAPGAVVRLRAKSAARWGGVLPNGVDFRVIELRKLSAVVEAPDGVRAVVAIRELEKAVVS